MNTQEILTFAIDALEDIKAEDITQFDVRHITEMTKHVVICTATSSVHCNALASNIKQRAKKEEVEIRGIDAGKENVNWILVDMYDVVVHIMLKEAREFYALERLWDIKPARDYK